MTKTVLMFIYIIDAFGLAILKYSFLIKTSEYLILNIYILIALALDETIILDVPQFPMQNIYQSCDLGRAIGRRKVNAIQ